MSRRVTFVLVAIVPPRRVLARHVARRAHRRVGGRIGGSTFQGTQVGPDVDWVAGCVLVDDVAIYGQ